MQLAVTSLIPIRMQPQQGWGVWPGTAVDARVTYMESLISNSHPFKKHLWPGGFGGCPKLMYKPLKEQPEPRRHVLKPTKTIIKPSSSRKQRRISNYFPRTASNPSNTNDQIIGLLTTVSSQVSKLQKDFKAMRQLIKRKKTRSHNTRTTFHRVISCDRKDNLQSRGCQTENEEQITEAKAPTTVPFLSLLSLTTKYAITHNESNYYRPLVGISYTYGGRPDSLQLTCYQPIRSSAIRHTRTQIPRPHEPCTHRPGTNGH